NIIRVLNFPFAPLFCTIVLINLLFYFNNMNILINRNSFKKLLDFFTGQS
ncbi:hypothetical protein BDP67DRAFT_389169, partial [Colletotrichum lupini]